MAALRQRINFPSSNRAPVGCVSGKGEKGALQIVIDPSNVIFKGS